MSEKPAPVSLEPKLREHWEQAQHTAELMTEQARKNLARIGLLYGGQLSFDDITRDRHPDET